MKKRTVKLGKGYAGKKLCAIYDHDKKGYSFITQEGFDVIAKDLESLPGGRRASRRLAFLYLGTMQEVTADERGRVEIIDLFNEGNR